MDCGDGPTSISERIEKGNGEDMKEKDLDAHVRKWIRMKGQAMTIKKYTQRVGKLYLLPLPPYESFYWAPMGQPPCPIHTRLDLIHLRVLPPPTNQFFGLHSGSGTPCPIYWRLAVKYFPSKGLVRKKYRFWIWGICQLRWHERKKQEMTRKWKEIERKDTKGTEKTWMDMLAHELKEKERQRQ